MHSGQIAHLDRDSSNNEPNNLTFLCLDHHDAYDSATSQSKGFRVKEVKAYRAELEAFLRDRKPDPVRPPPVLTERPPSERRPDTIHVPHEICVALDLLLPEYEPPGVDSLAGDWLESYDPATGFPIWCTGSFTGRVSDEFAFFAVHRLERRYRVTVLSEDAEGSPVFFLLEEEVGAPSSRYVETRPKGRVRVSSTVWQHGGPRTLHLRRDAIVLGTFESAACIHYWNADRAEFQKQWISD